MKKFSTELSGEMSFLSNYCSLFRMDISDDFKSAIIYNPYGEENLHIYYDVEDSFTPYMLSFSFQHVHLTDQDSAKEWIDDVLSENVLSIEFFRGEDRSFGGQINKSDLPNLSYELLEHETGYYGLTKLAEIADSIKVRGWTGKNNLDGSFIKKDGKYFLVIT